MIQRISFFVAFSSALWVIHPQLPSSALGQEVEPRNVDFQSIILPLLSDRCFSCHGPDPGANDSGLRLDERDSAIGELPSGDGRAISPGKPDKSELIARVTSTDPDLVMPPPHANRKPISPTEAEQLRRWIAAGAHYQKHWSFEPIPAKVTVPELPGTTWPQVELDHFVLVDLQRSNLEPSPESERWRWLRRVTFDLSGLPPTAEDIADFEADTAPKAYERVVDRLLKSPHFGQHFATQWLDVARYADSYGYQSDLLCNVWPYRDFVVDAFNRNLPYDQFITWQLAGDLLPNSTIEQQIATAFNRLHRQTNEGGSLDEEWRAEYAADRVQTFGTAFLGLTVECARCHDHKFDPISTRDYYQLVAFFNSIDEFGTYNDMEHIPTPSLMLFGDQTRGKLDTLQSEVELLDAAIEQIEIPAEGKVGHVADDKIVFADPLSRYSFENRNEKNEFPTTNGKDGMATTSPNNVDVEGKTGKGLLFSGDDGLSVPAFRMRVDQPFAISFWLRLPETLDEGMVWHQSSGTDTGFSGTEMKIVAGRLHLAMVRFWPGNAIAVETIKSIPKGKWVHVIANYDGLARAKGLQVFVDGTCDNVVIRDNLYKSASTGDRITFGERFRTRGLTGAAIDELQIFDVALSDAEIRSLQTDKSIAELQAQANRSVDTSGLIPLSSSAIADHFKVRQNPKFLDSLARRRVLVAEEFALNDGTRELMVMKELPEPRATYILERGQYNAPKTDDRVVQRETPHALSTIPDGKVRNRMGLAQWLTHPDHPLTARVAVNRIWQNFFGSGIVESIEDFGLQGSRPSHPQLLDWLARDFVEHHWDVKRLCKQIALSATYRQTSKVSSAQRQSDPANRQLARGPARRLGAEELRDLALAASGLLDDRLGGPPVSPYQPEGLWTESNSMSPAYRQSVDRDLYRRSLYSIWKRTAPLPNMLALDAPGRETCTARRSQTNTPVQAFVLLNDPQFVEAARVLAKNQIADLTLGTDALRIDSLFKKLAGRSTSPTEMAVLKQTLDEQRAIFLASPDDALKLNSMSSPAEERTAEQQAELAAYTVVAQTILNGDAAVWKR